MRPIKDEMLEVVLRRAEREAAVLAGEFVRAASEEREAILASLEMEQWVAEGCRECL